MKWRTFGESVLYDNPWIRLTTVDVEVPGTGRIDHHVVRSTNEVVGTVMPDPDRGILLLYRHRFITDRWGWEIPAGKVDEGEALVDAAEREAYEETGWRPGPAQHVTSYYPSDGLSDQRFHVFVAHGATHIGPPPDTSESERIEWKTKAECFELLRSGEIHNGLTMTGLLWYLSM